MTSSAKDILRGVERSRKFERPNESPWRFSTRSDYLRHLVARKEIAAESDLSRRPELVIAIQRHWHGQAQHGCRFAQVLSRVAQTDEWRSIVVPSHDAVNFRRHAKEIREQLTKFENAPETQAVSILLPTVTTVRALVACLSVLRDTLGWKIAVEDTGAEAVSVQIRVPIAEGRIESWVIGFAPLDVLPITRQAPITELAFSVKPKRLPPRSARLNANPSTAHVADLPVPLDDSTFDHFWDDSHAARLLLTRNADPAQVRARVTFCLPLTAENTQLLS